MTPVDPAGGETGAGGAGAAVDVAGLVAAQFPRWGGPPSPRVEPVSVTDDAEVRDDIRYLAGAGMVAAAAAVAVWEAGLAAPWTGEPVWIHADLFPGNLLASDGRLTAVIDFGLMGVGDPAADLLPAWALLTARDRAAFRDAAEVDDATWARGRAVGLKAGLGAVRYYHGTGHALADAGRHALAQTLAP